MGGATRLTRGVQIEMEIQLSSTTVDLAANLGSVSVPREEFDIWSEICEVGKFQVEI